jgi:hypothetical protein
MRNTRKAVDRHQHRQDSALVGLRPVLAADGGQQHDCPPQGIAVRGEAAADVLGRLEIEHARRAERDHQQRHPADVAELPPGEGLAQRVHAAVGGADDAHQLDAAQRAGGAEHREHAEHPQRRDQQRDQHQPVVLEEGPLSRREGEAHHEVDDEHDPQYRGDRGEDRIVARIEQLDDHDRQPGDAEPQHQRVEPRLQMAQRPPPFRVARHRAQPAPFAG